MSDIFEIRGGKPLRGEVTVSGAKNAVLPLLISGLLSPEPTRLRNIPNLEDVAILIRLLEQLGATVVRSDDSVQVSTQQIAETTASYALVKSLRASFWVLAPLLARAGSARVALPGGDVIGARPVDIHLEAFTKMGADIQVRHGEVIASAPQGLRPTTIDFRFPSVGATHQVLMAAALTPGETILHGAAREPEVVAVAELLTQMGAEIRGAGSSHIRILGRKELRGAELTVIGDRIEAATYLLGGLATRGSVTVRGVEPVHLGAFLRTLRDAGVEIEEGERAVSLRAGQHLRSMHIVTGPFPEFATDLQAISMAALTTIPGEHSIEETVFEGRFSHVAELCRLGAEIRVSERTAHVMGGGKLSGAQVEARDIRAAAALVIAGAAAEGTTLIHEVHHLRRGYDRLDEKLRSLGAVAAYRPLVEDEGEFIGC